MNCVFFRSLFPTMLKIRKTTRSALWRSSSASTASLLVFIILLLRLTIERWPVKAWLERNTPVICRCCWYHRPRQYWGCESLGQRRSFIRWDLGSCHCLVQFSLGKVLVALVHFSTGLAGYLSNSRQPSPYFTSKKLVINPRVLQPQKIIHRFGPTTHSPSYCPSGAIRTLGPKRWNCCEWTWHRSYCWRHYCKLMAKYLFWWLNIYT